MATVVPCASCYARSSFEPLQLFGKSPHCSYMSLLVPHGPRRAPRPRHTFHGPRMTLRQICRMLRVMRQVRNREAAATAAAVTARKQVPPLAPSPVTPSTKVPEKRCLPACFRRRRGNGIKRIG